VTGVLLVGRTEKVAESVDPHGGTRLVGLPRLNSLD